MKSILNMGRDELLTLDPETFERLLLPVEVVHMATVLGAFWSYDYGAAKAGHVGMHALLKSERHSDGFFVSKILLEPLNLRSILAKQIVRCLCQISVPGPDYVAGIPDGATLLGEAIAPMLRATLARMQKVEGRLVFPDTLPNGSTLLFVEDFCTRGTGFVEAVLAARATNPTVQILPFDPVILNRGGITTLSVDGVGKFRVRAVVEHRVQDWAPEECPLCRSGSVPIKPKATDENWRDLLASQLP